MPSAQGVEPSVDCPVCREPLIVAERDGIELDVCLWCHGLWFDVGEIELLAEKLGRAMAVPEGLFAKADSSEKPRSCPRCDRAMEKVTAGASPVILLDRCAAHGLWFDHGELGALVRQLAEKPASHAEAAIRFMGESFGPSKERTAPGSGEVER